jgi:protein-S-isoprenylcysteine O-methyltransferase Ste14
VIGKLLVLLCILMLILTPLALDSWAFVLGLVLVILGLTGLVKALFDFKNTPLDQPVTRGIYKVSRHPQIFMSSLVILGSCIAIGSWTAVLTLVVVRLFGHLGILAEEERCLETYGEAYRVYMARVPRYLVFF